MAAVIYTPNTKEVVTGELFTDAGGVERNALHTKLAIDASDEPLPVSGTFTVTSSPVQFNLDGTPVEVSEDTSVPANTRALPVVLFDKATGLPASPATEATLINVEAYTQATADSLDTLVAKDFAKDATLAAMSGKLPSTLGQKAAAASISAVLASDQSALPLSPGAATSANQSAANTSLSSIDGKVATAANQATANTSLSSIAAKDFATQTTLASFAAAAATEATLAALKALFPSSIGQKAKAASLSVTLPSDQAALPVVQGANTAGSQSGAIISAATTINPPANAVGFILQADPSNTDTIRYRVGGTAAANTGMALEPSRDTGLIPVAAAISVFPVTGSQTYQIQWVLSS